MCLATRTGIFMLDGWVRVMYIGDTWLLETVYIARIDVIWMNIEVFWHLETVYIARNDVYWMDIG